MKLKYEFVNGDINEIEVDEYWGNLVLQMRKEEAALDKREKRHTYSIDAIDYEGTEYGTSNLIDEYIKSLENQKIKDAFSKLTAIQQRRLIMLADGLSIRKISEIEGVKFAPCLKSVELAKKKFKKFFKNGVSK